MEMLLMGACLSMFGLAVACLAFGAATRTPEEYAAESSALAKGAVKGAVKAAAPTRFFVDPPALPMAARTRVPIEALLLQIENHVRLEQAAAECFLEAPNASRLHSRTTSTFVN
jgi:stage V sporulation protein SpoVS